MDGLPWHPAIVHFPLSLAALIPVLGAVLWWVARSDDQLAGWVFRLPLGGQVLALVTAIVAQRTGDGDHSRVKKVIDDTLIQAHEQAGEQFTIAMGVVLAIWFASALAREAKVARTAAAIAIAVGILAAGLGLRAGHAGGELVYVHGAAEAWHGAAPADEGR
jgi:hypothetical protein